MYGITLMARVLAAVFLPALVASCGSMRPSGPPDAHDCGLSQFEVASPFSAWGEYRRALIRTQGLSDPNPSFNVLALSAGGEYGAYGAGFLSGWSSVGDAAKPSPRRDIQVVTGVSTGAILATHAFVGMDSEIEAIYRSLSGPVLYKPRSTFALLIANSLLDASGKEALIAKHLERKLINAVAAAPAGRFLYLGVVDMDTGRFLQIDMLKLARTIKPLERRDDCYRAVVNASSAIPIAFPPVFVDARMLADGGARRHLFVTDLPPEAALPTVERRLFSLIHGTLDVSCQQTENGVLQIAGRTLELFSDQTFKDSIRLADNLAKAPVAPNDPKSRFQTFYAAAAEASQLCRSTLTQCPPTSGLLGEDLFCKPFMNCLADRGKDDGKAVGEGLKRWLQIGDLNLSSVPACASAPARSMLSR